MTQTHCGEADFENHWIVRWAPGATQSRVAAGVHGPGSSLHQLDGPFSVCMLRADGPAPNTQRSQRLTFDRTRQA